MKAVWVAVALMVSTGALAKDPADKDELAFVLKGGMQIAPGDLDKVDPEPQTYGSVGVKDEHLEIKPKQSVTQITESLDVGAVMDPIHLQPSLGLVSNIQAGGLKLLNGWNLSSCSFGIGLTSTLAYGIHNQKDPKAQDGQDIAGFGTLSAGPMAGLICEPTGHNLLILAEASLEASGRVYGESDGTHVGGGLKGTGTLQVSTTGYGPQYGVKFLASDAWWNKGEKDLNLGAGAEVILQATSPDSGAKQLILGVEGHWTQITDADQGPEFLGGHDTQVQGFGGTITVGGAFSGL